MSCEFCCRSDAISESFAYSWLDNWDVSLESFYKAVLVTDVESVKLYATLPIMLALFPFGVVAIFAP